MSDHKTPSETAHDHLSAVQAYADALGEEWAKVRPDGNDVKFLTASIGRGLKLAEIYATLNIGHQLERIADQLAGSERDTTLEAQEFRIHNHAPNALPLGASLCKGCRA